MPTVLIGGGSGLVGSRLSQLLTEKEYRVIHLSRKENLGKPFPRYRWDLEKGYIDERALETTDYVINLAGAGIADKKWTPSRKKRIIDSRVKSTLLLRSAFENSSTLKAFISASATGFYGSRGSEWLQEDSLAGEGFLATSTKAWEKAITQTESPDYRTVALRIGIVLSGRGGALPKILVPFSFGTASYFGKGDQYFSWIHIDDVCNMFIKSIQDPDMQGIYNAVAPRPVTNLEMVKTIAKVKNKNVLFIPVPAFALRLGMGEMADVVLTSARVSADKMQKAGFEFEYGDLSEALSDIFERKV